MLFNLIDDYRWTKLCPMEVHPDFSVPVWKEILRRCDGTERDHFLRTWMETCFPGGNDLAHLSLWMKLSKSTVVLTGSRRSTESGIPDFRSKDGWWRKVDPRTVATVEALNDDYPLFREFYQRRIEDLKTSSPHQGHFILSKWEDLGLIQNVATQNMDGFHQQSGSKQVYELHDSIRTVRCNDCAYIGEAQDFLQGNSCSNCSGKLRPNVVLFGENLPEKEWSQALAAMRRADLVIVIGTSLQVYPVHQLSVKTIGKGCHY